MPSLTFQIPRQLSSQMCIQLCKANGRARPAPKARLPPNRESRVIAETPRVIAAKEANKKMCGILMIIRLLNVLVGAGKFGKYAQISATWGENVHMSLFLLHVLKKMIKPAKIRQNVIKIEKSQHFSENTYFFIANPRRKAKKQSGQMLMKR